MFFKILYLSIVSIFAGAFVFNFILNILRDSMAKKKLKNNPALLNGKIREIKPAKNRSYLVVEFRSPHNNLLLSENFEIYDSDKKDNDYVAGQEVTILYNRLDDHKKIRTFPIFLSTQKIKLDKNSLFLNIALMALGFFVLGNTLFQFISSKAFTTNIALVSAENGIFSNSLYIFLMIIIYFVLSNYLIASIVEAPKKDIQNYLKLYGNVAKAKVTTFKFGKSKNAQGTKESLIDIEYRTNKGEEIKTKLSSFMYTETQEEYIDIIYDPREPKTVVYVRL